MIQLRVHAGKTAGSVRAIPRFPWIIGRSPAADFQIVEPGVWGRHLELWIEPGKGVFGKTFPKALARVNGKRFKEGLLRNGDCIEIGSVQLEFGLGPVRQRTLRPRELATWAGFIGLCAGELAIIYWLLQ